MLKIQYYHALVYTQVVLSWKTKCFKVHFLTQTILADKHSAFLAIVHNLQIYDVKEYKYYIYQSSFQ